MFPGGATIEGGLTVDTINAPVTIGGDCDDEITIKSSINSSCGADFLGNVNVGGDLSVTGGTTLGGGARVDGDLVLNGSLVPPSGGNIDIELGDITVDGITSKGDVSISGGIDADTINISGDATIGGSLEVTQDLVVSGNTTISGGGLIDGPVTIGGECGDGDTTIFRGEVEADCDFSLATFNAGSYTTNHTQIQATGDGSSTDYTQTLQPADGVIALLDDVALSEALYLVDGADFTTQGPSDLTSFRPGASARVSGDVFINTNNTDGAAPVGSWTSSNVINYASMDARGVFEGDRLVYVVNTANPSGIWLFLEVTTVVDLDLQNRTGTTYDITSSTGDDVTLLPVSTTEAGLMTSADKVQLDANTGDIGDIKTSVGGLKSEIDAIDGRVSTNEGNISSNSSEINALQGSVGDIETSVGGLKAEIDVIDGNVTVNENNITSLQGSVDDIIGVTIPGITSSIDALKGDTLDLPHTIASSETSGDIKISLSDGNSSPNEVSSTIIKAGSGIEITSDASGSPIISSALGDEGPLVFGGLVQATVTEEFTKYFSWICKAT